MPVTWSNLVTGIDISGQCWYDGGMKNTVITTLLAASIVGIGSAAGLGLAPAAHADPALCANHEDPTEVHAPGGLYIHACAVGRSGGGAFADADGDGFLNGVDRTRTGGPLGSVEP